MLKLRNDFTTVWTGITSRGYVEAQRWGYLRQKPDGAWMISQEARDVYAPIAPQLKSLWRLVRSSINADPSPDAYTWVVEHDTELQGWMTTTACPTLGIYQYGCLAIAAEIAREQ